ncbi:hypothetical protein E4T47_01900 [Aureobasidium subglaciale]|nr:hypothetical protein E4T47_01900 [Aureobasidium subglaciale]
MKLLPSLFGCLAFHRALAQISQNPGTPSPAVPPKAFESTTLLTSVINKLNSTPGNVTLDYDLVDSDTATDFDENDPEHVAPSDSDDNDGEHNPLDTFESEIDFDSDNVAMGDADGKKPPPDDDEGQATDDEGGKKSKKEKKKDKKEDKEDQVKISFYRFKKDGCKRHRTGHKTFTQDHCKKLHRNFHSYRLKPKSHHKHKIHKKNKDDDSDSGDESDAGVNCTLHVYTDKHCGTEVFASAVELGNCTNVNNDHGNTGSGSGKGKGKGKHPHKKGDYNSVMVTCVESDTGYDSETASNSTKKGDPDLTEPESEDEGGHDGEYKTFSSTSATGLHSYKDHTSTKSGEGVEETSSSRSHHDEDVTSKTKHHESITESESTGTKHHKSTIDVEPTSPPDTAESISGITKEAAGTGQSSRTVTHVITSTKAHRHAASGKALYASGLASYAASLSKYAVSMSSDPDLPYVTFPSGTELPTQTGSVSEITLTPTTTDSPNSGDDKKDKTKQEKEDDEGQETENEDEHDKKDDDEKPLP